MNENFFFLGKNLVCGVRVKNKAMSTFRRLKVQ